MSNPPSETKPSGYGQILSSSLFTGGAQVVTMLAAFVRMKIAAVTIGTAGVGMLGLLQQSTGLVGAIAGLGLSNSGVREVAAAAGSGDDLKRARVIRALRVLTWITGLLGALICVLFAGPLSRSTFGDESHRTGFMILGASLFMTELATGQSALLRGLGCIRELALQSVVISLVSSAVTGTCYFLWGLEGIVPSLVALSMMTLAGSWWYARKVETLPISLSLREIWHESKGMLRMGLAFVWSAGVTSGVAYAIGIMVRDRLGIEGNGLYSAAWGMSGLFVGIVLTAMGQDFYPRLTSIIHRPAEACALINEQLEIGVLLALPGIVATVVLRHWLISLLYSVQFMPAAECIGWFALGCYFRVLAFPFGYVLIARGDAVRFAISEAVFSAINLGLAWMGLRWFGLSGVGAAFMLMYGLCGICLGLLSGHLIAFRLTRQAFVLILGGTLVLIVSSMMESFVGLAFVFVISVFCLRGVVVRLGKESSLVRKLFGIPVIGKTINKFMCAGLWK